jgi:hypothetical protein
VQLKTRGDNEKSKTEMEEKVFGDMAFWETAVMRDKFEGLLVQKISPFLTQIKF